MRLVIATPLYPPEPGGPATYAKLLEEGLPKQGVETAVVKFADVRKWPKLLRHFLYGRAVARALKDADAVLALDPVSVGYPALDAAKKTGKPFFVKVVGDYAWEQGVQRFGVSASLDEFVQIPTEKLPLPVQMLRKVETHVARHATKVIVPSEYLKGIVAAWGIHDERIEVIHNSVALEEGGALPSAVETAERPRVVSVGRLVPWKNMRGVIDAVAKTGKGTLIIVGDGPEQEALKKHAGKTLPRTVFTGALSHKDVLAVVKDADVFVLNSTYEGLSHLLIEALSLGTPVVATRAGGNTELVGNRGTLVEVGDTDALSRAIARAAGAGRADSRQFAAQFSPDTMLRATAALIRA